MSLKGNNTINNASFFNVFNDLDNGFNVYICAQAKFCNFEAQENLYTAEKEQRKMLPNSH